MTGTPVRIRRHLVISGLVQGVGYRMHTQRVAAGLQLSGWVRNLPTGEVETCVEGPCSAVEQLTDWCRRGPAAARVTGVTVADAPCDDEFIGFVIRY